MKKLIIPSILLVAYSLLLIKIMVLKDMPVIRIGHLMFRFGGTHDGAANFIPFKTIGQYLLGGSGWLIGGINIIGNIGLLVPIGWLVAFIFPNLSWKKMLVVAVASGLLIEGMQEVLRVGIFDIDDVILNALGVMVGYWSFAIFSKWLRSGNFKPIVITTSVIIIVAVTAAYALYPRGHQPMNTLRNEKTAQATLLDEKEEKRMQGADPCNGTGGTGQIVSVDENDITIKGANGKNSIVKLTDKTIIKNSLRPATKADLKTGDGVTVVIDESETATLVLICSGKTN